jgi:uncharacterized membrane protein
MNFDKKVSSILIILLVVAVIGTVYLIINPNPGQKFTEFYILGSGGKAGNYPTNLTLNENGNVTIGIVNHEQSTTNYNLLIKLNGTTIQSENLTLQNNETKMVPFTFNATKAGNNQTLEFQLYKLPDNQVYRSLDLYLNVQ